MHRGEERNLALCMTGNGRGDWVIERKVHEASE